MIFVGLRLGCASGFIGVILAELLITPTGIGDLISYNQSVAEYPGMYAAILSIIIASVLFIEGIEFVEENDVPTRETYMTSPSAVAAPTPAPAAAPIVSVRNVHKTYPGGVEALSDISLDFPEGKLTTLLGPSGCGKTTLLKIIAGLLPATSGEVLVEGRPVTGPGPERAFVFQDFALMPWATVVRNVAFGLELRGMARSEREAVAARYIEQMGLRGFESKYPHELSGGMRQRVGLARALAVNAKVLMMDEPFSAVDEQTRRKFQEDLLELVANERKTFIFVTHSIEEAVYVSDRIVLLHRRPGRVHAIIEPNICRDVDPEQIRRQPGYLDAVENIWQSLKQYLD